MSNNDDSVQIWADELLDDEFTAVTSHNTINSDNSTLLQKHFSLSHNNHYVYGVLTGFNYHDIDYEFCKQIFSQLCSYLPLELMDRINQIKDYSDDIYQNILNETFQIIEQSIREQFNDVLSEKTAMEISLTGNDATDYPNMKDKLEELSQKLSLGFSCVVTIINQEKIFVANIGNTRAMLYSKVGDHIRSQELSKIHNLENDEELERLEKISINTEVLKINNKIGNMMLTRCLGNLRIKDFYKDFLDLSSATENPILYLPNFYSSSLNDSYLFLVLASSNLIELIDETIQEKKNFADYLLSMIKNGLRQNNDLKMVPNIIINNILLKHQMKNKQNEISLERLPRPILLIRTFVNNNKLINELGDSIAPKIDLLMKKSDTVPTILTNEENETKNVETEATAYVDFTPLIKALELEQINYDSF